MAEEVMLTKEGKEELEKRLEFLKLVKRPEITERIKTAREFGDLSENAEYDAAKNEQAMIEGEILEIEHKLKYAVIIKDSATKKGTVSLGSKVDFIDDDLNELFTYEIVGTTEADVELGRISNESPIGNALLGRKAGETVKVVVPAGITSLTIKKVY
ncbi:MAG: transcription elongation factor GreA [Clostridia bacterium]|nr:transcription elongation factor GreA [Clostridia bacterium]